MSDTDTDTGTDTLDPASVQMHDYAAIKRFIFVGNAVFTIRSERTGKHYTYNVRGKRGKLRRFVHCKAGDDWVYIGIIDPWDNFRLTQNSKVNENAPSYKAFYWFWGNVQRGTLRDLSFYHAGRCGKCGRELTDPESIASGIGPICAGKLED